ncbi:hypothetical protein [uncultured Ruthenibacterium sp.]|uniref:hypothetical protein n=1 Tax=uncultured Ruthenibacterium sp. TaxID=1905347 RepID=UPI00349E6352
MSLPFSKKLDLSLCRKYLWDDVSFWERVDNALHWFTQLPHFVRYEDAALYFVAQQDLSNCQKVFSGCMEYARLCKVEPALFALVVPALAGYTLPAAIENQKLLGAREDQIRDSFQDFSLWANRDASGKLMGSTHLWFLYAYTGKIVRLGRLEFERMLSPSPYFVIQRTNGELACLSHFENGNLLVSPGLPILNLHIPSGGHLNPDAVDESIYQAKSFFGKLGYPNEIMLCDSWLLDPNLANILPSQSNILSFQKRFFIMDQSEESTAVCFMFGWDLPADTDLERIAQTTLQKNCAQYLKKHGKLHDTIGILRI